MSIKLTFDESIFERGEPSIEMEVDGKTVGQCLDCAFERQPALKSAVFREDGDLIHNTFFTISGKSIYTDNPADVLSKPVKDNDEIVVVYASTG